MSLAPHNPTQPAPAPGRWLKRCSLLLLLAAGVIAWGFWQMGEPNRRARAMQEAIHPGMNVLEIEKLLTGRYATRYQVEKAGEWTSVSREEFAKAIAAPPPGGPSSTRLFLTFLGMSPGRSGITVQADGTGRITTVGEPKGSD